MLCLRSRVSLSMFAGTPDITVQLGATHESSYRY